MATLIDQTTLANFELTPGVEDDINAMAIGDSKIFNFNGQYLLVQKSSVPTYTGYAYITDVTEETGHGSLLGAIGATFASDSYIPLANWVYDLPAWLKSQLSAAATTAAQGVVAFGGGLQQVALAVGDAVGKTLANALKPALSDLTLPLIVLGGLALFYYMPKRATS